MDSDVSKQTPSLSQDSWNTAINALSALFAHYNSVENPSSRDWKELAANLQNLSNAVRMIEVSVSDANHSTAVLARLTEELYGR